MKKLVALFLLFLLVFAPVFAADVQTALPVKTLDGTASGTEAASNAAVTVGTNGAGSVTVGITGTWVGTVTFEVTTDGTNWNALNSVPIGGGTATTTATTNGNWTTAVAGYSSFRVRMSTYTSGTATVAIRTGQGTSAVICVSGCSSTGGGTTTTYNTTAPTLTNGSTAPLQSDVNGNLKVNVITGGGGGSTSTTTVPTTQPTNAPGTTSVPVYSNANGDLRVAFGNQGSLSTNPIYGTDPNVKAISQDASNNQLTVTAGSQDIVTTGSLASATSLTTTPYGNGTWAVQVSGTWAGTITWEGSVDGTNYVAISGNPDGTTSPSPTLTTTANGLWRGNVAGMVSFRVRMSTYTSGTAVVTIRLSNSGGGSGGGGGGGGGGSSAGTTTTIPTSVPTNSPGTTGVPNYSNTNGDLRVAFGNQGATSGNPIYGTDPNVKAISQDASNNQIVVGIGNNESILTNETYSTGIEYKGGSLTTAASTITFTNAYKKLVIMGYGYSTSTAVAICNINTTATNSTSGGTAVPQLTQESLFWSGAASSTISCLMSTGTGSINFTAFR